MCINLPDKDVSCKEQIEKLKAHNSRAHEAPNESVSPSRTRGSLPASTGQSESEAAGVQLAPVLCPPGQTQIDNPGGVQLIFESDDEPRVIVGSGTEQDW